MPNKVIFFLSKLNDFMQSKLNTSGSHTFNAELQSDIIQL